MSQSMIDRYLDFEELRPTGEASHISDEGLSEYGDGEPRRQRVSTTKTDTPPT